MPCKTQARQQHCYSFFLHKFSFSEAVRFRMQQNCRQPSCAQINGTENRISTSLTSTFLGQVQFIFLSLGLTHPSTKINGRLVISC